MKINVVILQNALLHYRVPFYESLGQSVDLKVVHSGEMRCTNAHFRNKTVNSWKIGPFTVQSGLYREIKSADIIIGMMDVHFVSIVHMFFLIIVMLMRFLQVLFNIII